MTPGSEALIADVQRVFTGVLNMEVPSPDTDLIETGRLDSLALVELLFEIERRFKVDMALEELDVENFRSIRRIAEFIGNEGGSADANAASA